jgi:OOP family OmpA-OmpF porin
MRYQAGALLGLVLLAGCALSDVEALKEARPTGSPFTQALSDEYRRFAVFEADEMRDWLDARHFARKGLSSARGKPVPPERLSAWRLPAGKRAELAAARLSLIRALNGGARNDAPRRAAKAQASFDCWVEQQEEDFQVDDIAACRKAFKAALAGMEKHTTSVPFAFDSARLSPGAAARLRKLVSRLGPGDGPEIVINGHADRAGTEPYNRTLSRARAIAVWRQMIAAGVAAKRMGIRASGEAAPAVATGDGVREARNRRAEIRYRANSEDDRLAEFMRLKFTEPLPPLAWLSKPR